jgi:outer membrane receptor protein involved in Fe transport
VAGRYTKIDGDLDVQALAALLPDGQTAARFPYREKSVWDEYQSDTFATLALGSGRLKHRFVAGVEVGLSTFDSEIGIASAPSLDIYDPVYGPRPPEPPLLPSGADLWRFGAYLQDQMSLGARWSLVPALRVSRLRQEDRSAAAQAAAEGPVSTETAFTPSLGIVFRLRPALSLYASYDEGFEPGVPGQYLEDGRALAPVDSRSLEAGVKADLLGQRLAVSLAGFAIRQTNVPEADTRGFYGRSARARAADSRPRSWAARRVASWCARATRGRTPRSRTTRRASRATRSPQRARAQGQRLGPLRASRRPIARVPGRGCGPRLRPLQHPQQHRPDPFLHPARRQCPRRARRLAPEPGPRLREPGERALRDLRDGNGVLRRSRRLAATLTARF